jgi:hypothetical protein
MRRGESIRISNLSRISFEKEKKNDSGWVPPLPFSTPPDGAAASPRVLLSQFHFAVFFFLNSQKLLLLFYFLFFELLDNIQYKKMFKLRPSISHCPKPPLFPRHGGGPGPFGGFSFFRNAHRVLQSLGDFEST